MQAYKRTYEALRRVTVSNTDKNNMEVVSVKNMGRAVIKDE